MNTHPGPHQTHRHEDPGMPDAFGGADGAATTPAATVIGHVDGSVAVTTGEFHVVLADDADPQLDDLVVTRTPRPRGQGEVRQYGIVTELYGTLDGARIPSDTARIAAAQMPGELCRRARVTLLRTNPERYLPPVPGATVDLATGSERALALFEDQMGERKLCLGVDQANLPVHVDFSYVNGEKGGHLSISGVSGVAAKTSFAMTTLYSLFQTEGGIALLGAHAPEARALVFNVKGEDLLFLDHANARFAEHEQAAAQWSAMGVDDPRPFTDIRFYVPSRSAEGPAVPAVETRPATAVTTYGWSVEDFICQGLLPFVFSEREDARTQVGFVEQRVRLMLARHFRPVANRPGAVALVDDPASGSSDLSRVLAAPHAPVNVPADEAIDDFRALVDRIAVYCDPANPDPRWTANAQPGTLGAFLRRLFYQAQHIAPLVRRGVHPVDWSERISVVDIHALHDSAQRFVVGAMLSQVFANKRGREPLRFVLLDELNKYAPKEGTSPIKDVLVDIAARGRSLGVILVGAQQSAATVEPMVTGNASVQVVGRLAAAEAESYRFLSPTLRDRASRFLPGTMILNQPMLPAPLPIRVPFPPFATNLSEAIQTPNPAVADGVARVFGS